MCLCVCGGGIRKLTSVYACRLFSGYCVGQEGRRRQAGNTGPSLPSSFLGPGEASSVPPRHFLVCRGGGWVARVPVSSRGGSAQFPQPPALPGRCQTHGRAGVGAGLRSAGPRGQPPSRHGEASGPPAGCQLLGPALRAGSPPPMGRFLRQWRSLAHAQLLPRLPAAPWPPPLSPSQQRGLGAGAPTRSQTLLGLLATSPGTSPTL